MWTLQEWNDRISQDTLFWFCALAGTGLFVMQFALSFLGIWAHDEGNELDIGKFKWLSKQPLTGFLLMFGWVGLTSRKEFGLSFGSSCMIASMGGIACMSITAWIFQGARKLRSEGTVFRIENAIGEEAMVYQRISPNGVGKVSIPLQGFTYEIDAISYQPEEIASFTQVKIIKIADEKTVVVVPIR